LQLIDVDRGETAAIAVDKCHLHPFAVDPAAITSAGQDGCEFPDRFVHLFT